MIFGEFILGLNFYTTFQTLLDSRKMTLNSHIVMFQDIINCNMASPFLQGMM